MRKFKTVIDFDKKLLKKLVNTENSGVTFQHNHHHLVIQPIQLNNLNNSIKDVLNEGIPKYHQHLGGILLGYQNIQLLSDKGTIHNDLLGIHFDLEADFYVFKPEVGTELKGIVNRKSKDHLGVLVYNSFNVSIPKTQTEDEWLGTSVDVGCEILFHITNFEFTSYLPYIRGEILSVITKTNEDQKQQQNIPNKIDVKHKNAKRLIFPETQLDESIDDDVTVKKKKKKKDKHKNKDPELEEEGSFQELVEEKYSRKKSKKRKRDEQESNISLEDLNLNEFFAEVDESINKKKSKKIKIDEQDDLKDDQVIAKKTSKKKKEHSD